MEAVILVGIQATGKSTFCQQRFADTHVRINLDMLRTRRREERFVRTCLETRQPFVVDNTNPTRQDRARYVPAARAVGFRVVGYYFGCSIESALEQNRRRAADQRVPERGVRATLARLEPPRLEEGFDALYRVRADGAGGFVVEPLGARS